MTDKRTKTIQADIGTDMTHRSVSPPLYMSSTYKFKSIDEKGEYDYGRTCLLYTSPSPRDKRQSRMPSSA